MSSASKTLELLDYFSPSLPEIGLSQLCKLANRDKATTYRHLQSLEEVAFIEQDPVTKRYRLGPALLQLARTREITVPRKEAADPPLRELANATGETVHVSVLSGRVLYNLAAVKAPRHSIRVVIESQTLPLHATASGLCALAYGPDDLRGYAERTLDAFTSNTITDIDALRARIEITRRDGFAQSISTLEEGACGFAAPVFDQSGHYAGSVSVASVADRFTPELENLIKTCLPEASRKITRNWGGKVPDDVENAWAKALAGMPETGPEP